MALIASFGSWKSPITTDLIVQESVGFMDMQACEDGVYWTEVHPKEKGRMALVHYDGKETFLLPDVSVRTRVHEYGGGAFAIINKAVVFSNDRDYQLYTLVGDEAKKLTDTPKSRYADGNGGYWVIETHNGEVENALAFITEEKIETVHSGHDFYSSPRVSPDGKQLAFITWDFPNMQWDGSTLWLADRDENGKLKNVKPIAGGLDESICQIQWSPNGILHFVSDKTGFWNLYRYQNEENENLCPMEAEFGVPPWVFGRPSYAFLPDGDIITMYAIKGRDYLGRLKPKEKMLTDLRQPFTLVQNLITYKDKVYFFGASPELPRSIVCYDPAANTYEIIKQSFTVPLTEEWLSKPHFIEYPSLDGKTGYGFYYPPNNPNYKAPKEEKPPLIVECHGGPTACSYPYLDLEIQYWTSRGFAFVDVNYGGSTGFGREYFKRLEGTWGILDVHDCISAAKTLAEKGLADPNRLVIRGGSAGGFTALAALAQSKIFAAGTSYYGVSDLELLYQAFHKFEAKYTDQLVAPYPEKVDVIRERSPVNHIDKISSPILLLQGDEDKIVPPNQTFTIYEALKKKGIPTAMLLFKGEGHGFRQASNIKRALDAELYFYGKILGLELADSFDQPPLDIIGN